MINIIQNLKLGGGIIVTSLKESNNNVDEIK
jgi:hypothetical protein